MAVSAVKKDPSKSPAPQAPATPATPQPRKRGRWLYAVLALAILGGAGGAGAWWYSRHEQTPESARPAPSKPPVFAPLEAFTVNLKLEEHQQFIQVGLTLRLASEAAAGGLKLHMPEIRDGILLLLSSKTATELLTLEGKRRLSSEIQSAINAILAPGAEPAAAPAPAAPSQPVPAVAETAPAQPDQGAEPSAAQPAAAAPVPAPAPETAPVAAVPAATPAPELPVTAVLFTSFIIQ